ncbi:hypothetical protein FH972_026151 [Carpinus fangiana]|uniref:MD-2-related lipid-recognition domain-containing protein n=1 Tax=Carpinus fangiana TaxID=176857 RepID=A0A5N6L3H6_9ROSI|nr:hypothetical protein FH972_026151 [Carpinus fangiana]
MHLLSLLPTVLLASTAASRATHSLSAFGREQVHLNDGFPIPGDNPLKYCEDPKDYILEVTKVDLSPNPPKAGTALSINGVGNLRSNVTKAAKVHLQVKYGMIRLINQEVDFCDHVKEVGKECPLEKGPLEIKKDVNLPNEIPPGTYTVIADVFQEVEGKDPETITCFEATVTFSRG